MTWSHDGVWMVSTDDRGFVKYWQSNMNNVHTFQAHNEPVRCSRWESSDILSLINNLLINGTLVIVIQVTNLWLLISYVTMVMHVIVT